jgi:hypothetical protein
MSCRSADHLVDVALSERGLGRGRMKLSSDAPIRPVKTTATLLAWRCCCPVCRKQYRR